jgi:crossover junction endodeoxyribonuclease RuvC
MIVLGLDPGTRHTGYGVVETDGRRETVLTYGVVDLPETMDHTLRLRTIYDRITGVIDAHVPDECAVEMPIYAGNAQAMLKLGRAQAALMLAAVHRELPVTQYTPAEVKKAVTGNGNAAKEQVAYMIRALLALPELPAADAADALAVALCHGRRVRQGPGGKFKSWAGYVAANPERVKG